MVGTRSAIFAPLENLGLIIVDEEQESSYKQEEVPRYHGRDTAVYRARLEGAVALLGSATPSLETYHNARAEKYRLLTLASRVENRPLADVRIVDLREEFRREHRAAPVSEALRAAIALRLEEGTQAMVLINRRGYSWSMLCRSCGSVVQCQNCSIALTYHKSRQRLECHYCGYPIRPPKECPKCHAEYLVFRGRRRRARGRIPARAVSQGAHRAARSRHGPHQARIPAGARRFRRRRNRHSGGHADGREGPRFSARHAGGRRCGRSGARPPGFPRRRTHLPVAHAGGGTRRARRTFRRSAGRDVLSGALRDSIRRAAGLRFVLRKGSALPARAALSAVHRAGHRARARPKNRERHPLVAGAWRAISLRSKSAA